MARTEIVVLAFLGAGTIVAMGAWGRALDARGPETAAGRPRTDGVPSYVSSSACVACHPGEHASFGRTFHRTMTQDANATTVLAPFERRGEQVFAGGRRVVLATGSHRHQAYWTGASEHAGDLEIVPFVWLVKEKKLIPREEAFLTPPGEPLGRVRWSSSCIACHAVAGEPRHDAQHDTFDARVAELGIACEACHGPGGAHVARHRDPFERYAQHASKTPDPTIVHPRKIAPERSAAICGQCHSYAYPKDENDWWSHGYARSFRAGDALEASRYLLAPDQKNVTVDADEGSIFWPDGTIRVGGREYNGLVLSPCYAKGEGARKMTCVSCHAMHDGDPAGQIAPEKQGNAQCTSCHDGARFEAPAHAHHAAGSPGAECVSCHMPKTSYALLSAVRSHRVETPDASASLVSGKPDACNLCHVDRSLAWSAARIGEWFVKPVPWLPEERMKTAEGAVLALSGNAAVRVIVADALGSVGARAAAPPAFERQLLGELARDRYAAVRFVAARSLASLGSPGDARSDAPPPLAREIVEALLAARDEREVTISE